MPMIGPATTTTAGDLTQAVQYNQQAVAAALSATKFRAARNRIMVAAHQQNPDTWTIAALADAIGISESSVARIVNHG